MRRSERTAQIRRSLSAILGAVDAITATLLRHVSRAEPADTRLPQNFSEPYVGDHLSQKDSFVASHDVLVIGDGDSAFKGRDV
jgi:hypothetical protein